LKVPSYHYCDMYDFHKSWVFGISTTRWTNHHLLHFDLIVDAESGELKKSIAKYSCLTFIIYADSGKMMMSGSYHKYFNYQHKVKGNNQYTKQEIEKGFNGNTFDISQFAWALNDLSNKFGIDPARTVLLNLEFGLNIKLLFHPDLILDNLLYYKRARFNRPLTNTYREAKQTQLRCKCYDKALQYNMNGNVMRFEFKHTKMATLKSFGIRTAKDLLSALNQKKMGELLIDGWGKVFMYDPTIKEHELKHNDLAKVLEYKNPNYWMRLKSNRMHRPKKHYEHIMLMYSENIKRQINHTLLKMLDVVLCKK
jgi:hypothetical protein